MRGGGGPAAGEAAPRIVSIAKRLFEARAMPGRPIYIAPSRQLWDGSKGEASCPSCRFTIGYTAEEKLPGQCPRCHAPMTVIVK